MLQYNWNLYNWNFVILRGSTERAKRTHLNALYCHGQSDTHVVPPQLSLGIAPSNSFLVSHSIISYHATFFSPAVALFVRGLLFIRIPAQNVIKEHSGHERRRRIQRCTLLFIIKRQRLLSSKRLASKQPSK